MNVLKQMRSWLSTLFSPRYLAKERSSITQGEEHGV